MASWASATSGGSGASGGGLLPFPLALGQLHALLAGDLEDLREQALDLRLGQHGVDDRLQLALQEQQQGGQLLDAQRSRDPLLGVGVDDGQAQRPALGVDPAAQGGEIGLALGDPAAGDEQERGDRLRVGDELLEALLGDGDLVRGGLAGPGLPGAAGRLLERGEIDDSVGIGHGRTPSTGA